MEIVINVKPGGFGLSRKAALAIAELGHPLVHQELSVEDPDPDQDYGHAIERNDPILIRVVRDLGPEANGPYAGLKIVSIPDNVAWQIEENDAGEEWVAEQHRTWD